MVDPADNTYELTVNVRDSKADDGTADMAVDESLDIVVTVENANDAPTFDTDPQRLQQGREHGNHRGH